MSEAKNNVDNLSETLLAVMGLKSTEQATQVFAALRKKVDASETFRGHLYTHQEIDVVEDHVMKFVSPDTCAMSCSRSCSGARRPGSCQ